MTYANPNFLVEPDWLLKHRDDSDLVIVDCPWEYYSYTRAHIPGAVCRPEHSYVKGKDADDNISLHLPNPDDFKDLVAKMGIGQDTEVVLYDEWGSIFAARLWWVLRYYGHQRARILNGGWQAWVSGGLPISCATPDLPTGIGDFVPTPLPNRLTSLKQLKEIYNTDEYQILDARSDDDH